MRLLAQNMVNKIWAQKSAQVTETLTAINKFYNRRHGGGVEGIDYYLLTKKQIEKMHVLWYEIEVLDIEWDFFGLRNPIEVGYELYNGKTNS